MPFRALSAAVVAAALTVTTWVAHPVARARVHLAAATTSAQPVAPLVGFTIEGGRDYVGAYRTLGSGPSLILYCPNPRSSTPRYVSARSTDRLQIFTPTGATVTLDAARQWRVAYLLATFGRIAGTTSADRVRAAAVSQAMNILLGNLADVHRRARSLPASVATLTARLLADTSAHAGPYRITFGPHPALAVGQTARSWVQLVAHSGRAVPGQRFAFTARGAAVPATAVADGTGRAAFTYRATATGLVTVNVQAVQTATNFVLAGALTRGVQRLVAAGHRATLRAGFAFSKAIGGPIVRYTCDQVCDGRPVETVDNCTDAGTAPALFTIFDNGVPIARTQTSSAATRQCARVTVRVPDAHLLSVTVRYLVGGRLTTPVAAGTPITIDCPPPPVVTVSETCNCRNGELVATLTNTTGYTEAIVVNGAFTATQAGGPVSTVVVPGKTLTLHFLYGPGAPLDLSIAGAAQRRTAQQWNTGVAVRTVVQP
jgi:hypothetical protein